MKGIIHVGLHKTGTTTIQRALYENRQVLNNGGFNYALPVANHSEALVNMFASHPVEYHLNIQNRRGQKEIREHAAGMFEHFSDVNAGWEGIILSGEVLSQFDLDELHRLKEYLDQFITEYIVVACVRHPIDLGKSLFQQRVKGGRTISHVLAAPPWVDFRYRLEKFDKVFGADNVRVFDFESAVSRGSILQYFLDKSGVEVDVPDSSLQLNTSLTMQGIHLMSAYSERFPLEQMQRGDIDPDALEFQLMKGFAMSLGGDKLRLPQETAKSMLEESRPGIRWLSKRHGIEYEEYEPATSDQLTSPAERKAAESLLDELLEAASLGSEPLLRKMVELSPSFTRGWYDLSMLQWRDDRVYEAFESSRKAADLPDATIHFMSHAGIVAEKAGQYEDAEKFLEATIDRNPRHVRAHRLLSSIKQRNGDFGAADRLMRRARELGPKAKVSALVQSAYLYLDMGRIEDAEIMASQALELAPENPHARKILGA